MMKNGGELVENVIIKPVTYLKQIKDIPIIIAVDNYAPVVLQLEAMGIKNYILWSLLYQNNLQCKSREIMDRWIPEKTEVKNVWMNHLVSDYGSYDKQYFVDGGSCLDMGCGCCKELFNRLCKGYDAWGIDCCEWKKEYYNQKVEDFSFPEEWKERFVFGYGEELPFREEQFDTVTCWYVLEHVQDYKKCILEMLRVVKKGGYVILNAPDYRNSYEEHYRVDFGKSLVEHKEEFKQFLMENGKETATYEEINFITKPDVLAVLDQYQKEIGELEIIDEEEQYPESRVRVLDNHLVYLRYIALVVRKM